MPVPICAPRSRASTISRVPKRPATTRCRRSPDRLFAAQARCRHAGNDALSAHLRGDREDHRRRPCRICRLRPGNPRAHLFRHRGGQPFRRPDRKPREGSQAGADLRRQCLQKLCRHRPGSGKRPDDDARKIAEHRQNLGIIARDVAALLAACRARWPRRCRRCRSATSLASASSMCRAPFTLLEEFLDGDEGRSLDADARKRLQNVIQHLTAAQMDDMCRDFHRDSQTSSRPSPASATTCRKSCGCATR
jgi:hypothetical protein